MSETSETESSFAWGTLTVVLVAIVAAIAIGFTVYNNNNVSTVVDRTPVVINSQAPAATPPSNTTIINPAPEAAPASPSNTHIDINTPASPAPAPAVAPSSTPAPSNATQGTPATTSPGQSTQ